MADNWWDEDVVMAAPEGGGGSLASGILSGVTQTLTPKVGGVMKGAKAAGITVEKPKQEDRWWDEDETFLRPPSAQEKANQEVRAKLEDPVSQGIQAALRDNLGTVLGIDHADVELALRGGTSRLTSAAARPFSKQLADDYARHSESPCQCR